MLVKQNQVLQNKLNILLETLKNEDLPDRVEINVTEQAFGWVLVEAQVTAKIMDLRVSVDILHQTVPLLDLATDADVISVAKAAGYLIKVNYRKIFD